MRIALPLALITVCAPALAQTAASGSYSLAPGDLLRIDPNGATIDLLVASSGARTLVQTMKARGATTILKLPSGTKAILLAPVAAAIWASRSEGLADISAWLIRVCFTICWVMEEPPWTDPAPVALLTGGGGGWKPRREACFRGGAPPSGRTARACASAGGSGPVRGGAMRARRSRYARRAKVASGTRSGAAFWPATLER